MQSVITDTSMQVEEEKKKKKKKKKKVEYVPRGYQLLIL